MDDLVAEFLSETEEGLAKLDNELIVLESNPHDQQVIGSIFRIMHTLKGTCGFLGFGLLESVAHASEDIMNKIRDGALQPTADVLTAIFQAIDAIKEITQAIKDTEAEPENIYQELIASLRAIASGQVMPEPVEIAAVDAQAPDDDSFLMEDPFAEIARQYEEEQRALRESGKAPEVLSAANVATTNVTPANIEAAPTVETNSAVSEVPDSSAKKEVKVQSSASNESIRVRLGLLDKLMQTVSELVLSRNQLMQISRQNYDANSPYNSPLQRLSVITTELQESVMKTRMQPISNIWSNYPRIVRDLANELGKKVKLVMEGEDTELDRHLIELIKDPLTHMLRNSIDHGVEMPDDRLATGKDETGTVTLRALHEGGYVVIQIIDDGKGLNIERIRQKVVEKGIMSEEAANQLSTQQITQYIFHPGFSTAEKVTAVSGRGVGMDVVKTNVEKIGGAIELSSEEGKGTKFSIKIPLTLAIMPVLIVSSGQLSFALPMMNVVEILRVNQDSEYQVELLNDSPILRIRERILPLISLGSSLGISDESISELIDSKRFVVVVKAADSTFGLVIDRVFDIEEIVVKSVSSPLKKIAKFSGNTVLGDGSVIMILDPNSFVSELSTNAIDDHARESIESFVEKYRREQRSFSNLLLCDVHENEDMVAIPLEVVSRLEEIHISAIEEVSNQKVVQYRDTLMRIIKLHDDIKPSEEGLHEVVVFTDGERVLGLIVKEINDIIKHEFDGKNMICSDPRYMSAIVINGKTTQVLDISYFFKQAFIAEIKERKEEEQVTPHVLLVDDSAFFRKFIPPAMTGAGYKVTTVDSVEKAIELLEKKGDYQAIVTDINMPGKDGKELGAYCKNNDKLKSIPIIALSAFSADETLKDSANDVFDAYIPKTQHSRLVQALENLIA